MEAQMKARVGPLARWISTVAAFALLVPAAAQAELTWQRVADPGPGSTFDYDSLRGPTRVNFAVANGVPYVAVLSNPSRGVRELAVYRAVNRNTAWQQIDGVPSDAGLVRMAAVGSVVWISWVKSDAQGIPQVHVGTLSRSGFRELSPVGSGRSTDIASYEGRPYITFATDSGVRVVRLRRNGRSFENVDGILGSPSVSESRLTVFDGRLYVSYTDGSSTQAARLNRSGNRWQPVDAVPGDGGVLVRGTLYTYSLVGPAPEAPNVFTLYATRRGHTEEAPNPTVAGNDVTDVHLLNADGTLWMLWIEGGPSAMAPPRIVHVAMLVRG
jgi:hypothetical protein